MVSTFTTRKRLEKQNPGENSNTWGGFLNTNALDLVDECFGLVCVAMTTAGDSILSTQNGATDQGRRSQIVLTGAPTSNVSLFAPAVQSFYLVRNKMTGAFKVTLKNNGGTTGVDFSGTGSGAEQGLVVSDGTHVREVLRTVSIGAFNAFTSAVIAVVSNVATDATGGAGVDFVPFMDASEGGSLNKVPVSTFFNNAFSTMNVNTTIGALDQLGILSVDTSTARMVTYTNVQKGINSLTEDTQPSGANDFVATYDASALTAKKVKVQNLNAPALSSKTGNYTVLDSDRNSSVSFSGLSADATLTLPAASGRAGFVLYVSNEDTSDATAYGVIVDPNSAELIDGVASRKGYSGTRITIICDGTGWKTVSGNWRYYSGNQTISAGSSLTLAHGLNLRPKKVWVDLICTTAESGYSIGDIIPYGPQTCDGVTVYNSSIVPDATNLNVRQPSVVAWPISVKGTGAYVALTAANWRIRYYAED